MRRLVLLLCVVLCWLVVGGIANLLVCVPYRAKVDRIASLEADLTGMTMRLDEARRRLARRNADEPFDMAELVTPGANGAAALAALQERVRRAVAAHNGQALSTVGALSEAADGLSQLTVGLTGRFEERTLFEFLRELEGGTPPVIVNGLTVRPLPIPGGPPLDVSVSLISFGGGGDAP